MADQRSLIRKDIFKKAGSYLGMFLLIPFSAYMGYVSYIILAW